MKNAIWKGLCYREMLLARRSFLLAFVSFLCMAVLMLLVLLSFRIGNLALLPDELQKELKTLFLEPMLLLPVFLSGMEVYACAESSTMQDAFMPWKYFRMASPIGPWQFACAKYLFLAAVCMLGLFCSFGYAAAVCGISGIAFDTEKIAMIMTVFIVTALLAVANQMLLLRFHSKDLAGVVLMGALLTVLLPLLLLDAAGVLLSGDETLYSVFKGLALALFPVSPLLLAGILLMGCVGTRIVYGRREQ